MRLFVFTAIAALFAAVSGPAADNDKPKDKDPAEEIDRLVKMLKDPDSTRQIYAIKKLGGMGPDAHAAARPLFEVTLNPKFRTNHTPALQAIEKISPKAYEVGRTLILDDSWFDRADALKDLEALPEADRAALFPVVIKAYRFERLRSRGRSLVLADIVRTLAIVYPTEPETRDAFLESITYTGPQFAASGSRRAALGLLDKVELDKKVLYKALVSALADPDLGSGVLAVKALGDLGADAKASLPTLKKLKFHKEKLVRDAADAAVAKIEAAR
ncbi:MAG: hypothetical protein ACRC7O_16245 [Fimbriiglobus sp.]